MGPPGIGTIVDPSWMTRFRLHHRGVNAYRDRRLFVAGDAAHIHSPAGGQGMNTGIQDAINLGWKLATVLRGGPESLLDSYNAERRPVGLTLLAGTDRAFSFISSPNPIFRWLRNLLLPWVLPWVVSSKASRATAYKFASEFGISYKQGPIVGTGTRRKSPAVVGGDRLLDGPLIPSSAATASEATACLQGLCVGPTHHLLLFAGADISAETAKQLTQTAKDVEQTAAETKQQVRSFVIYHGKAQQADDSGYVDPDGNLHDKYGFDKQPGYIYVRPDSYIGHIGSLEDIPELVSFLGR
jgi:hypothetical protein